MVQKNWNVCSEKEKQKLKDLSEKVKKMLGNTNAADYCQENRCDLVLLEMATDTENVNIKENVSDLQFLGELLQECRGKLGIGSRYGN